MENGIFHAAAGLFSIEGLQGSPWMLVLAIVCFVGGIWYVYRERKTKTKDQRVQEQKQLSKRFMDNINRNQDYLEDDSMSFGRRVEDEPPQKAPAKAPNARAQKKRK